MIFTQMIKHCISVIYIFHLQQVLEIAFFYYLHQKNILLWNKKITVVVGQAKIL